VKKRHFVTSKDKKDWISFTKNLKNVPDKEVRLDNNINATKTKKLDLHGFSLDAANKLVKKFIIKSSQEGYKKILIVTGKGLRSKVYNDPYRSNKMNVLKHSIPEYIKNDEVLFNSINKITKADIKDGGEGALCVFLKSSKKIKG